MCLSRLVFPVVIYGCEIWTIKKAEHKRVDAFEMWCWRRLLRVPWTARRSNQTILKEISPGVQWKDWCWSWNSNTLATWCEELTHWKRPWCWERLKAGEEGDDRGWDGWMASRTQWTWVWASSGRVVKDKEGWRATVHGVTKSPKWLSDWTTTTTPDIIHLDIISKCKDLKICNFSSVQSLSCVRLFVTPWTAAHQASLSITQSLPKLMSIESVMPSNHLILCHPFLLPSIFPSIRVFSNESVLHIRWPEY